MSVLPQTELLNRDVTSLGNFVTIIMATDWTSEERVLQKKVVRFAGHFQTVCDDMRHAVTFLLSLPIITKLFILLGFSLKSFRLPYLLTDTGMSCRASVYVCESLINEGKSARCIAAEGRFLARSTTSADAMSFYAFTRIF